MASKDFFKVNIEIKKPTQSQIDLVRRRALSSIRLGRGKKKLDAKSVEAMLRIVSGRYSDLMSELVASHRNVEYKLDSKFAQGVKEAREALAKIQHDVKRLEGMGYGSESSSIDYLATLERLKALTSSGGAGSAPDSPTPSKRAVAVAPTAPTKPVARRSSVAVGTTSSTVAIKPVGKTAASPAAKSNVAKKSVRRII